MFLSTLLPVWTALVLASSLPRCTCGQNVRFNVLGHHPWRFNHPPQRTTTPETSQLFFEPEDMISSEEPYEDNSVYLEPPNIIHNRPPLLVDAGHSSHPRNEAHSHNFIESSSKRSNQLGYSTVPNNHCACTTVYRNIDLGENHFPRYIMSGECKPNLGPHDHYLIPPCRASENFMLPEYLQCGQRQFDVVVLLQEEDFSKSFVYEVDTLNVHLPPGMPDTPSSKFVKVKINSSCELIPK